ncbi:hypothetical protein OAV21_01655 [bacterium]|jgi:hypothetical protein|nr:hypothetical protein [bacterium]
MDIIAMIAEILRGTDNGDDLHLIDREMLDFMSDAGACEVTEMDEVAFCELCARVRKGYRLPSLHDIEHLAITRQGFVYWKNSRVDHYELPTAFEAHANQGRWRWLANVENLSALAEMSPKPISGR